MQFTELGIENEKTLLMLPGTGCTWELNFMKVIDDLAAKYHLICVDYDGFETDPEKRTPFTDILTIVSKVEDYIIENYEGRVDGAYGSSLGGTLSAQLAARGRVHVDHCFIGGSDLDESGKLVASVMTETIGTWFENSIRDEKKAEKLKARFSRSGKESESGSETSEFIDGFAACIRSLEPGTMKKEFYSDYVTRLPKDISVPGTIIHVIYALKMGKKYERRYTAHFRNPDIRRFDMQHEGWLFQQEYKDAVLACIDECMAMDPAVYAPAEEVPAADGAKTGKRTMMHNFGDPQGLIGRLMLSGMNSGHMYIMKYAVRQIDWPENQQILDIGCGGGASIRLLLNTCPGSKVAGLDISEEAVKKSKKVNRKDLGTRCRVLQGSAAQIPFKDRTFHTVTAFETVFFWPDIVECFREVHRVLRSDGRFLVACDAGDPDKHWDEMIPGMTAYTAEQLAELMQEASFTETEIHCEKNIICVYGRK